MITIPAFDEYVWAINTCEARSQVQRQLDEAARMLEPDEFARLYKFAENHARQRGINFSRSAASPTLTAKLSS